MSERLNRSITILEKTAKGIEAKKISEEKKKNQEKIDLMQKIRDLEPRITDLIEAGQKCQELGIDFPVKNEMPQYGYDSRFEADGVNHDLGFITKEFKIQYLCIKNGGFDGPWDFYTDGKESFPVSNKEYLKGATGDPQICDMKKFLNQFDSFESAFYQWIDSLNKAEEDVGEADPVECVKKISLRNLYENGIKSLTFGGDEEDIVSRDGYYVLEHNSVPFIEDGEELKFQFFVDAGENERFALGTSKEEHGVYFTRKEYELAVENPAFLKLPSFIELGKTYKFAGYDWTVSEVDNKRHVAVIQSHGITHGMWPGFVIPKFGNGNYYGRSIDGQDISDYDEKMSALYNAIKDVEDKSASYGKGLYLVSKEKAGYTEWCEPGSDDYWQALKKAAGNASSFGCPNNYAWLGTVYGSDYAWCVGSSGNVYDYSQNSDYVVAPAFNLDLSKVEVVGDEIIIKDICNANQRKITTDKQKSTAKIEKQRENARKLNELVCHLAKLLESDDKRYSFEFAAGGTMEIFDKIDKIGYAVHIEPIEYDADGNATNL